MPRVKRIYDGEIDRGTFRKTDFWDEGVVRDILKIGPSARCQSVRCGKPLTPAMARFGWGRTCFFNEVNGLMEEIIGSHKIKCFGPYGGRYVRGGNDYIRGAHPRYKGVIVKNCGDGTRIKGYTFPSCDFWAQDGRICDQVLPQADAAYLLRSGPTPWHCATCWFGVSDKESGEEFDRKVDAIGFLVGIWNIGREIQDDQEEIKIILRHIFATGKELRKKEDEEYKRYEKLLRWSRKGVDPYH